MARRRLDSRLESERPRSKIKGQNLDIFFMLSALHISLSPSFSLSVFMRVCVAFVVSATLRSHFGPSHPILAESGVFCLYHQTSFTSHPLHGPSSHWGFDVITVQLHTGNLSARAHPQRIHHPSHGEPVLGLMLSATFFFLLLCQHDDDTDGDEDGGADEGTFVRSKSQRKVSGMGPSVLSRGLYCFTHGNFILRHDVLMLPSPSVMLFIRYIRFKASRRSGCVMSPLR